MRTRRLSLLLAVAAMLTTAGCAGLATTTAGTPDAPTDGNGDSHVRVSATGEASADPDQAVVRLAVVATADSPNAARERVAENASRMRAALRDLGVGDDQVRTVHYGISPDHRREKAEPTAYRAIHAYEVTLSDVDRVGAVVDAAVANGAARVDGVRFTLSDERRRQLYDEALADAMDNARSRADTLAESANLSLVGVHAITASETRYRPYEASVTAASAGGADTAVESGPVTVTARVDVVYNATAA